MDKTSGNVVAPPASESLDNVAVAPKDAQPTVNLSYQGSAARPKYRLGQNLCRVSEVLSSVTLALYFPLIG